MSKCDLYRGFRYPAAIISHGVGLYFRFALSLRDIEELMTSRGISCGVRWTSRAIRSMCWCSAGATTGSKALLSQAAQGTAIRAAGADHDKLKSYGAAKAQIMPGVEHRQHKGLNNRAEVSHQPTRQRQMWRFKSPGHAQRFLSAHEPIDNAFRCERNRLTTAQYRCVRAAAFSLWNEVAGVEKIQ